VQTPDSRPAIRVRDATDSDMGAVTSIYAQHVLHGLASFEEVPPPLEEMTARRASVLTLGLPYLVAELDGRIVGSVTAALPGTPYAEIARPTSSRCACSPSPTTCAAGASPTR